MHGIHVTIRVEIRFLMPIIFFKKTFYYGKSEISTKSERTVTRVTHGQSCLSINLKFIFN